MARNDDLVAVLLQNAELLLTYNAQAAVLPNSKLEEALAAAHNVQPLDYHSDECVELRKEVFRLVNAMKPATLAELQSFPPFTDAGAETPESERFRRRHQLFRYSLAVVALVLFAICGKYTIWSKNATALMDEIQAAQGELASERFSQVLHRWETLLVYELATNPKGYVPPVVNPAEDFQLYREHVEQFAYIQKRHFELQAQYNPIRTWWVRGKVWLQTLGAPKPAAPSPTAQGSYSSNVQSDRCLTEFEETLRKLFDQAREHPILLADGSISVGNGGDKEKPYLEEAHVKAWVSVRMREAHRTAFSCFFGFDPWRVQSVETTRTTYLTSIRWIRDRLDVLNSWILPGIYGALGAVILTLRVYVNPVMPNPQRFRTTIRIALGGFVGIIVGWFWSPQSNQLFEFANISVGLFTMAFLFGYGIDAFMSLLDRVVGSISSAIENAGARR